MLRELDVASEPALNTLSRMSWINHNQVSGPSSFVDDLNHALEQVADTIKPLVESKKYMRNFFDKAARCVLGLRFCTLTLVPCAPIQCADVLLKLSNTVARFTNAIVRSRPLKENGAEQVGTQPCYIKV